MDDIFLVKNTDTELVYTIFLQIIAGNATNHRDYETGIENSGTVLEFPPNQQRLQVFGESFIFEILPDGLPEGEETVEISCDPLNNPGHAYTRPQTGAATTIFILDDADSKRNSFDTIIIKLYLIYLNYRHHCWLGTDLLYCV